MRGARRQAQRTFSDLSLEDSFIRDRFVRAPNKWPLWVRLLGIAGLQDIRDAELMLSAQRQKWRVWVLPSRAERLSDTVLLRGGPWRGPVS